MKKKFFLMLTVIFSGLASFSQEQEPLTIYAGEVKNITISDDMDVILMQAPENERSIKIGEEVSEQLWARISNETLQVGKKSASKKGRITVILYVQKSLSNIFAEGTSMVDTRGILNTGNLNIYVENEARVRVVTKAKVNGFALDNGEVEITSTPLTKDLKKVQ